MRAIERRRCMNGGIPSDAIMTLESNPKMMEIAYKAGWARNPKYLRKSEAEKVTTIGTVLKDYGTSNASYNFPEFKYFIGVTTLDTTSFIINASANTPTIEDIEIPQSVTLISGRVFSRILGTCTLPSGIKLVGYPFFHNYYPNYKLIWNGGDLSSYTDSTNTYPFNLIIIIKWNDSINNPAVWCNTYYSKCTEFQSDVYQEENGMLVDGDKLVACPVKKSDAYIPSYITTIGEKAFYSNITENWEIPSHITTIENCAFQYCKFKNQELIIPNSVKTIRYGAFIYTNVTKVYLPPSLESLGTNSLANFPNGKKYIILDNENLPDNGSYYTFTNRGGFIVYVPQGKQSYYEKLKMFKDFTYTIKPFREFPDNFDKTFETVIQRESNMVNCTYTDSNLTVTLFSNISEISELMLYGITQSSVVSTYTFTDTNSHSVMPIFSDATNITGNVFEGTSIVTCTLPDKTKIIGNSTFKNCNKLTTINLNNITSIGENAFENCSSLTTLNLSKCESINDTAFIGCSGLDQTTIDAILNINPNAQI